MIQKELGTLRKIAAEVMTQDDPPPFSGASAARALVAKRKGERQECTPLPLRMTRRGGCPRERRQSDGHPSTRLGGRAPSPGLRRDKRSRAIAAASRVALVKSTKARTRCLSR